MWYRQSHEEMHAGWQISGMTDRRTKYNVAKDFVVG